MHEHSYQISVEWTGNLGEGTKDYRSYERSLLVAAEGKPDLLGSADPQYMGDATKWNPEELFLASLSSCQMLWYLHLCTTKKIVVTEYVDRPTALLTVDSASNGRFKEAILRPSIKITDPDKIEIAKTLHAEAHKKCFIANSINFPVHIDEEGLTSSPS